MKIFFDSQYSKAAKKINIMSQDIDVAENELSTLKRLNSDYIVKYLGFYSDSNFYYIITKYYEVCLFFIVFLRSWDANVLDRTRTYSNVPGRTKIYRNEPK